LTDRQHLWLANIQQTEQTPIVEKIRQLVQEQIDQETERKDEHPEH
jgi:hypothetical protein